MTQKWLNQSSLDWIDAFWSNALSLRSLFLTLKVKEGRQAGLE